MDTFEARTQMRDIAETALEIVERIAGGTPPAWEERQSLRRLLIQAREALPDAGYPGEATWRAVQRASMAVDTGSEEPDAAYWEDVAQELRNGLDVLRSLISPNWRRETDFHIIG